jgi:Tol biopolymer transport system component
MSLLPGSRLGDYEIVTQLGAGGMGAVYRAHDLRLKRDVALKILSTSAPAGQAARDLLQEARHAARFNHPNVCTIYEVEDAGATPFIAMEHVPGRPLSSVIPSGGLPSCVPGPFGGRRCDDRGGDDWRPGRTGHAAIHGAGGAARGRRGRTKRHLVAGHRAVRDDGGSPAIPGATALEVASNILHGPIPPLPAPVPPSLRAVIHRCLARSRDERYQHAGEIRAALETIGDSSRLPPIEPLAIPVPLAPRAGRRLVTWIAAALAAVVLGWWAVGQMRTRSGGVSLESQRPVVAMFGGNYSQATFSPDGSFVAFVDGDAPAPQIWVKNLAEGDPIPVTSGSVAASRPAWSPRNDQIVFARRGQGLWSVPPLGGTLRQITEFGSNPRFAANGERLVFERGGQEIWTARPDGSDARRVSGVPSPWYSVGFAPALSPDASSIVYILRELGPNGDLWVVPATGGQPRRLTADLTEISDPIWTADGSFIIYSSLRGGSRVLWRVAAHGGTPEPLTVGSGDDVEPALSPDGHTLIYTNVHNDWQLVVLEAASGLQRTIVQRRTEAVWPRVSPDGSRIAFFARGPFGDTQIVVTSFAGHQPLVS